VLERGDVLIGEIGKGERKVDICRLDINLWRCYGREPGR